MEARTDRLTEQGERVECEVQIELTVVRVNTAGRKG